ncbi:1-phosphofructokinase [Telmatospirillum sp. J64-1]|uniref:1-phosphofructokinase n=1 Tax=Telmatospirillum sp. J64-1 TaxID=2502183 RepID=UPI00115D5DEB|nr:1-phosphofructokinase [Telmatospirillum sp. J64-1]
MAFPGLVTVTLNAAIDHSLDCPGFRPDTVNRVVKHWLNPGGKGINVAAFLADWVQPVTATGFLGRDNPQVFEALFQAKGIEDRCRRVAGETRVNLKVLDQPNGQVTDINLPGLKIGEEEWTALKQDIEALAATGCWFVLAGSLPSGAPETAYAELVALLKDKGCFVALDASGPPMRLGVAQAPDLIKPNIHELEELLGRSLPRRADVLAAARELVSRGIGRVVVSLGADGALLVEQDRALHAQPPPTEVVSTVGAGDAMLSGVLAAMARGEGLEDCARRGTAFAVGTLTRQGPVLPPGDEIERIMSRVGLEEPG